MFIDEEELSVYGNTSYENRLVAFFDVLGWRNEIELAGTDSRRVARLSAITKLFYSAVATAPDQFPGVRLTSFSDCVVISVPYEATVLPQWIEALGLIQSSLAGLGFWIRGATTIGNLFHDSISVFGPALNRAYEMETRFAIYPRILVDQQIAEENSPLIEQDDVTRFIDPFTVRTLDRITQVPPNPNSLQHFNSITGASVHTLPFRLSGELWLQIIFARLSQALARASEPKVREKYAWWHNRIAPRLSKYPIDIDELFSLSRTR